MKGKFLSRFLSVLLAALMVVAPAVQLGVFAAPEMAGTVGTVEEVAETEASFNTELPYYYIDGADASLHCTFGGEDEKLYEGYKFSYFYSSYTNIFAHSEDADGNAYDVIIGKEGEVEYNNEQALAELQSVSGSSNETTIYNFLVNNIGFNTAGACGVLANIQHESSFNPNAVGDSGNSYGICQWNTSRYTALQTWCSNNGYSYTTLTGQLYYLKHELSANNSSYLWNGKTIYNNIAAVSNTAQGAYDAGHYWCYYFEVPADKESRAVTRGNLAMNTYWPEYSGDSSTTPSTDSDILSRIDSLYSLLGNKYFNVGQNTACGAKSSGHSCDNCYTPNIVNATWFKNMFGTVSTDYFPTSYDSSGTYTRAGWSCLGFSHFAEWYIFKSSNTSQVNTTKIGTYNFNYSNISNYAAVGDILRLNSSHSVIYISADSSGIYVLDCNYGTDYNCMVRKHTISYSSYSTFTISRATNRTVTPSSYTITFSAPGAEEDVPSSVTTTSSTYTIPLVAPKGFKYSFMGWYTGDGMVYDPGDTVSLTENLTLYAATRDVVILDMSTDGSGSSTKNINPFKGNSQNWYEITVPSGCSGYYGFYVSRPSGTASLTSHFYGSDGGYYNSFEYTAGTDETCIETRWLNENRTYYLCTSYDSSSEYGIVSLCLKRRYYVDYYINNSLYERTGKNHNESITIIDYESSDETIKLKGWSTSATGSVEYKPGDSYSKNADVELYPIWLVSNPLGTDASWTLDDGVFTISGTGTYGSLNFGYKETVPWHEFRSSIKSVVIENGIGDIANYSFTDCTNLTSVVIPESVGSIGYHAFEWCKNLKSIFIPAEVTYIGTEAFYNCTNLTMTGYSGSYAETYANENNIPFTAITTYTVSYNMNGGNGSIAAQVKKPDIALTLSTTVPTRENYTFKGWATSANGEVEYASGASYSANEDVTLYAVWQVNTYTVSYDANGGSGAPASQTKTHDVNLTLSSIDITRDGYTFLGWATSEDGEVEYASGATYSENGDVTLYAVWQANTYTVSYDANGGIGAPASQTKTHDVNLTLSTTAPTRDGYTFKGWATSANGEVEYASGASYTANEDVTLYAVWEEVVPASYDAYIYTEAKQKAVQGSQFTAKVYLEGTYDGYSFTLLPIDGLEILDITASGSGIYVDELSEGWMVSVLGGLAKTDSEKTEIVTVTVQVAEDALVGTRLLALSDVMISNDMGDKVSGVKYVYASIEITDQIPGDINGDGKFDYYDVSKLFAYYRKKATLDASVDTDVNGDGKFDYYDVSKLYAIFRGKAAFN